MIKAIYATREDLSFTKIIEGFQSEGIQITPVDSGAMAIGMVSDLSFDMLITDAALEDMSGKQLIEQVVEQRPFMSFAVTGDMPEKKFHDAYEGLGVLMQLPTLPGSKDARKLSERMQKISGLMGSTTDNTGQDNKGHVKQ